MNKEKLGEFLLELREQDKLRLFDKETNKEYTIVGGIQSYNAIKDEYCLDLSIMGVKRYERK